MKKNNSENIILRKEILRLKDENQKLKIKNERLEDEVQKSIKTKSAFNIIFPAFFADLGFTASYFFSEILDSNATVIKCTIMIVSFVCLGLVIFKLWREKW